MKLIALTVLIRPTEYGPELWFQRRSEKGPLDGYLEFPGGKIEPHESPVETACRELREEAGLELDLKSFQPFNIYKHSYEDRNVLLQSFLVHTKGFEGRSGQWMALNEELALHPSMLEANRALIKDVLAYLKDQEPLWQAYWEGTWPKSLF